jgi:NAD+ kinase
MGLEVSRVALVGEGADTLLPTLASAGLTSVDPARAELVVVYGGDGSLLGADRDFPDLPKLVVRRSNEFNKCDHHQDAEVFRRVREGRVEISRLPRISATVGNRCVRGINDIVFHNTRVTSGVRYAVRIDSVLYAREIVGDGVVAATPFGSSAYYRSITKSVFRVGLGLAFNNSTEAINHLVLSDQSVVELEVTRGPGAVVADNVLVPIEVEAGDVIEIKISPQYAEIWELSTLLCRDCRGLVNGLPAGFRHI